MTYDFDTQLLKEQRSRGEIASLLQSVGFHLEDLEDLAIQRLGIDATIYTLGSHRWSVEFKSDMQAHKTGNFFVETISVDTQDIPGWAYTSTAQLLGLHIPGQHRLLLIPMTALKWALAGWVRSYRTATCRNQTYHSHGVLVPLRELEAISARIIQGQEADEEVVQGQRQDEDQEDSARGEDGRAVARGRNHRLPPQRSVHTR